MSIKDKFVPYSELLDLFGVQRVNALTRCLNQNSIPFILDKLNKPLVLSTALEGTAKDVTDEQEEVAIFT